MSSNNNENEQFGHHILLHNNNLIKNGNAINNANNSNNVNNPNINEGISGNIQNRARFLRSSINLPAQFLKRSALTNVTNTTPDPFNSDNDGLRGATTGIPSMLKPSTVKATGVLSSSRNLANNNNSSKYHMPQQQEAIHLHHSNISNNRNTTTVNNNVDIGNRENKGNKENIDPATTELAKSIEKATISSINNPNVASISTIEKKSLRTINNNANEQQHNSLENGQKSAINSNINLNEKRFENPMKRPISTLVESEDPKKFKFSDSKGTEYEWEDLDAEDANDPFMVSEYVVDVFEYLHNLEVITLPNKNDLYKHPNIHQNRDILVNWMVKIHNKFGLLPETLFLALNIMDRFLCKERVQLDKLQLVGTASLFIASKYEEVYSPSVRHFAQETDGACDEEEIKEGEKFILQTLDFNLNYPNPMNFLRRISKADDYDIQSRTLAKYLLEISVVDFRFIGILPSMCAAAAMFISRKMLGKGYWDGNLIHYSGGYTKEDLAPVCQMIMDYLEQPVVHDEFFKKYASRRFIKASAISRQWAKKVISQGYDVMNLHEN
ncbi:related to G2/mitotic-specific cyclin-2 [Saccharomycodes ludwigii]|uniref:Related to G2/mitotic-specific cyclin-2 n=1 Tax=Saccharomycodes ludwigii TaxID=36035 RepID=A0A376B864_9ASCO|nr:hypothetical protein SCDLUD_002321 [Saccharomycodes ludwigii]KAH3900865.1 hypothetical protein SCDLUD_002321 [Saccharomycodes ludwigii]SSD60857.1 related to G2/mitotic-specific cyclin-2 [Saccharomycodes ludwigii]